MKFCACILCYFFPVCYKSVIFSVLEFRAGFCLVTEKMKGRLEK